MTKKHFIEFANRVKDIQDPNERKIILEFLLNILPMFNKKFDSNRFKDWINS